MNLFTRLFFILGICILFPSVILGQTTSDFTINTLVGDDSIPPSTPTLLAVIPTAPTQIDISWSASADNIMLGGYVLLRDGLPVATTTLTSFIDTGLTPETLYEYEVYAFDTSGNISTTSNAVATTTLAIPIVPPAPIPTPAEVGSSATLVFRLLNLDIDLTTNTALFSWETSLPSRYALRWGRSDAYLDGFIVNEIYRREQETIVTDLLPGTTYHYELIGYTPSGRAVELRSGEFTTAVRENLAPANVQNFTATTRQSDVRLEYNAVSLAAGAQVRIVRNHLGYPLDPYDGAVVYEGTSAQFLDEGALLVYETQYYTAFVVAGDGTVSSGAVAVARRAPDAVSGESTGTPPELPEVPAEPELPFFDFDFSASAITLSQGSVAFNFKSENVTLLSNEAFIISIKREALPDNLKSIIVTIVNPQNPKQTYAFLLRINKERDAYEAVIAPLLATGPSQIQVEIFDYKRSVIGRYTKAVSFAPDNAALDEVVFPDKLVKAAQPFFPVLAFFLILPFILLFWLYHRSKEEVDEVAEDKQ